jgi:hypothetical protein
MVAPVNEQNDCMQANALQAVHSARDPVFPAFQCNPEAKHFSAAAGTVLDQDQVVQLSRR